MLDSLLNIWTFVACSCILYNVGLVVYRLYLHPLKDFPGPRLNAATLWVDFYYDVYLGGQMTFKIKEWHDKYGPIVRINPDEIHILDPDFYEHIYTSTARPRDKWPWWANSGGPPGTAFTTVSHELHRMRRGLLSPYFSKKAVLEDALPIVRSKVDKLLNRLRKSMQNSDVIQMDTAFTALTMDIVTSYALDVETDYLDEDDFHKIWQDSMKAGIKNMGFAHHFGWLFGFVMTLPSAVMLKMVPPSFAHLLHHQEQIRSDVNRIWYEDEGTFKSKDATSTSRRSMVHAMRDAEHAPPAERTPDRATDEMGVLLSAGSETTAHVLSITSYYLLKNPQVLSTLQEEIWAITPVGKSVRDIDYAVLENLPYLSAVVSEGLRMSHGVVSRLPRMIPPSSDEKLKYKDWDIPKSIAFSMSSYHVITHPTIFPDPHSFVPERWLIPDEPDTDARTSNWTLNKSMNKYLTNFSKGSRACLGINLAYVEIYSAVAMLATHVLGPATEVGMELYETDFDMDVKMVHDYFTGFPREESRGIRMRSVNKIRKER